MTAAGQSPPQFDPDEATEVSGQLTDPVFGTAVGCPDQAWKMLDLISGWIKHAESKAAATVAASGVVAGVLYNLLKDVPGRPWGLISSLAAVCALLVLIAGVAAAWALVPQLWSRGKATSSLYFDHIAKRHTKKGGPGDFVKAIHDLSGTDAELVEEIAGQIWSNAHVARRKYRSAGIGVWAVMLAIATLGAIALAMAVAP